MVYIISFGKDEMVTRQCETPPSEEIRARVRALKPSECSECEGRVLHGNGWRTRTILASWNDWDTVVWYWRVECQSCGKSHCLMPEIVIQDLQYGIDVVGVSLRQRPQPQMRQSGFPSSAINRLITLCTISFLFAAEG
jgi:hypothetical protein